MTVLYVALVLVFVLAIAVIAGTALSRLGALDSEPGDEDGSCDLGQDEVAEEDVDDIGEPLATRADRERAKLRHPSARRAAAPAPGFGRGQVPRRRVVLPRPRSPWER
ncbi:hypothetical protein OG824_31495 [Streptomyces prunicolor]|uniref:hypothetical protein n=1 Tax=Streptomyces prunicolor TaxID=67348 RepID=UPI0022560E7E|nr:hypothetical protein [Streptomyces prunicolor]MCX5239734.1 hypothetical protein [Streptomyces prunicolor]